MFRCFEGTHQSRDAFVRAEGTQLVLRGQPFRFVGFNAAQVRVLSTCSPAQCRVMQHSEAPCMTHAWDHFLAGAGHLAFHASPRTKQALAWAASGDSKLWANLESLFEHAAQLGLRVGRVFAAASGPKVRPPFLDRFDELATQIDPEASAGAVTRGLKHLFRGCQPLAAPQACPEGRPRSPLLPAAAGGALAHPAAGARCAQRNSLAGAGSAGVPGCRPRHPPCHHDGRWGCAALAAVPGCCSAQGKPAAIPAAQSPYSVSSALHDARRHRLSRNIWQRPCRH